MSRTLAFRIGGMHCNACVSNLTLALMAVVGTKNVWVDLKSQIATSDVVSDDAYFCAVEKAGYQPVRHLVVQSPVKPCLGRFRRMAYVIAGISLFLVILTFVFLLSTTN